MLPLAARQPIPYCALAVTHAARQLAPLLYIHRYYQTFFILYHIFDNMIVDSQRPSNYTFYQHVLSSCICVYIKYCKYAG
jgi:hypothetical protein